MVTVPETLAPRQEQSPRARFRRSQYRSFVGPAEAYDTAAATQFSLLTFLGLREHHTLLDIGCGCLRAGRLFIPYLLPGHYFGIEPERWLIEEGIEHEIGADLVALKQPHFSYDAAFTLTCFGRHFDFILAHSIFSHASQRQIERCLAEARRVMHPASIFVATFVQGDADYRGDTWVYPDCVTYTLDRIRAMVEAEGLVCQPIDWPHPAQQTWLAITYPEHAAAVPEIDDATKMILLQYDLYLLRDRLARVERHPYTRFGLWVFGLLTSLRAWLRRVRPSVRRRPPEGEASSDVRS